MSMPGTCHTCGWPRSDCRCQQDAAADVPLPLTAIAQRLAQRRNEAQKLCMDRGKVDGVVWDCMLTVGHEGSHHAAGREWPRRESPKPEERCTFILGEERCSLPANHPRAGFFDGHDIVPRPESVQHEDAGPFPSVYNIDVPEGQWAVEVRGGGDADYKTMFVSGVQGFTIAEYPADGGDEAREACEWFAKQFRTAMQKLGAPPERGMSNAKPESPELLELARKAVASCEARKDEDVDAWAAKLAEDSCQPGALGNDPDEDERLRADNARRAGPDACPALTLHVPVDQWDALMALCEQARRFHDECGHEQYEDRRQCDGICAALKAWDALFRNEAGPRTGEAK